MIPLIICLSSLFVWLLYETDWLRVNLMPQTIPSPKRKWQFLKYGDDALMLCCRCDYGSRLTSWRACGKNENRWFGWRIPACTVKLNESTINFKEGCNCHRAKLLKDIIRSQKSKALPSYHANCDRVATLPGWHYTNIPEPSIELLVDGKSVANINGDHKRGMIGNILKPYTTKARVGRKAFVIPLGEADRITTEVI